MRKILGGVAIAAAGVVMAVGVGAAHADGGAFPCGPTNCLQPTPAATAPVINDGAGYYDGQPQAQYTQTVAKEQAVKGPEAPIMKAPTPVLAPPLVNPEAMTQAQYEAGLCASLKAAKPWIPWGCSSN